MFSNILPDTSLSDLTQQFFQSQSQVQSDLPVTESDVAVIASYFENQTKNREFAQLIVLAILTSAQSLGKRPRDVLEEFKKLTPGQVDSYVAYFLNSNRFPSSLIGIGNLQSKNEYVVRSIIF